MGCGSCEGENPIEAQKQRLWGRQRITAEVAARAQQPLDPSSLDGQPTVKERVLNMSWAEVVARLGFIVYEGKATFILERNSRTLKVVENTTIEHGLDGTYRVMQTDESGSVTRETYFNNGVFFVRNGPGKLRAQAVIHDQDNLTREEAWEPLQTFTRYFGSRLGLAKAGTTTIEGRPAIRYDFVLVPGNDYVQVPGIQGKKKPISIQGQIAVDMETAAPLQTQLIGQLEIPPPKTDQPPGRLDVTLQFKIRPGSGEEIRPKEFVNAISRHPVDLDPLRFLSGDTRTSTVIGGKKTTKTKKP